MHITHTLRVSIPDRISKFSDPVSYLNSEVQRYAEELNCTIVSVEDHGKTYKDGLFAHELVIVLSKWENR